METNISHLIDQAMAEMQALRESNDGPPSRSTYWAVMADELQQMKGVCLQFNLAYQIYRGIMRATIDEWPSTALPPALNSLGKAMDKWRREQKNSK